MNRFLASENVEDATNPKNILSVVEKEWIFNQKFNRNLLNYKRFGVMRRVTGQIDNSFVQ